MANKGKKYIMLTLKDLEEYKLYVDNISKTFKSKVLTQEHKDKIRQAHLGKKRKPLSQEWKGNLSKAKSGSKNPFFGKSHSQKTKDKISKSRIGKYIGENNPMFGKKRPDLTERLKQRIGEKNPNFGKRGKETSQWRGGISFEPYTVEFNKQLKELIRQRDGYKCQRCRCPEIEEKKKLSIHHIDYDKKNCLPPNLISLCRRCNAIVNTNRKKWTKYFQKKLAVECKQKQLCLARL